MSQSFPQPRVGAQVAPASASTPAVAVVDAGGQRRGHQTTGTSSTSRHGQSLHTPDTRRTARLTRSRVQA